MTAYQEGKAQAARCAEGLAVPAHPTLGGTGPDRQAHRLGSRLLQDGCKQPSDFSPGGWEVEAAKGCMDPAAGHSLEVP